MILARLALRNVLRQKRRSFLTMAVLATGFLALALAGGFARQTFQGLAEGTIRGGIGHVHVLNPKALEADEAQSLEHGIADGERLARELRRDPEVIDVLPRIAFMGLITDGQSSVAFLGTGVDPEREARHMACREQVEDGAKLPGGSGSRWLSSDPGAREVVLGTGLARRLRARVGSVLTLMATTRGGALNAVDVEVVGLRDWGFQELNDRSLTVSLDTAAHLVEAGTARSSLALMVRDPDRSQAVAARLERALGPKLRAMPWFERALFYQQVRRLYWAIFGFLGIVLALVVLLATANTLLMGVLERVRELGTLRALGLRPGQLLALLQWEGALLGGMGCGVGWVLTLLLRAGLNALHLQLPPPPGTSHGYELNIHWVPGVYLGTFVALQLVVQLSALVPGWKAARLRITEALRHV